MFYDSNKKKTEFDSTRTNCSHFIHFAQSTNEYNNRAQSFWDRLLSAHLSACYSQKLNKLFSIKVLHTNSFFLSVCWCALINTWKIKRKQAATVWCLEPGSNFQFFQTMKTLFEELNEWEKIDFAIVFSIGPFLSNRKHPNDRGKGMEGIVHF